ncbi:hypothetical protein VNO78_21091 [Psophocarpus tetragonolobus]|uniref:TF-B3 domain-containing protein n=1 Tax=Psophocarpus tetragonolobus TaxID=3891 RepID=A0AAN9XHC6_PSOTE
MSINHYSMDLTESTLWWPQQQPILTETTQTPSTWPPPDPLRLNLKPQNDDDEDNDNDNDNDNENEDDQTQTTTTTKQTDDEKEPMFEKPLTPSDVGKLNRLVIPKQHAEKYFPLSGGATADSAECKGLLLSFEDESGKCWRFRYSYWNSSQSYVLTKGWSRYVKDKRLDAGDVVLFERHRADAHRLFIGWRRRRQNDALPAHVSRAVGRGADGNNTTGKNDGPSAVGVGWTRAFYSAHPYPTHHHQPYHNDCLHAGRGSQGQNQRTKNSSSSRVLRLFGVNMECQAEHDTGPSSPQCSYNSSNMPSTQGTDSHHHFYHHHQPNSSSNPPHHMVRHQPYYY